MVLLILTPSTLPAGYKQTIFGNPMYNLYWFIVVLHFLCQYKKGKEVGDHNGFFLAVYSFAALFILL